MAQRRPILSAMVPRNMAPNIMPNRAELTMKAGGGGGDAHPSCDGRQGDAGDRQIVAVKDDDEGAPEQNHAVEAIELGVVGQNVGPCCLAAIWFSYL